MHAYGSINHHIVGTLLKESVRRAIVAIRAERFTFEATEKGRLANGSPDMVTSADRAAQKVYVKLLREWFPGYGIVAEEDALSVPCTHPEHDVWFTVDPLDGTKAFIRRQSHGVGTMVALVCDGEVISACIGDVMTQEVYSVRPDSGVVFRISEFGIAERLSIDSAAPLSEQYLLLRGPPHTYSVSVLSMVAGAQQLFGGYEIMGGSIGIGIARLWKREIGAAVIRAGSITPWDLCPVVGMSRVLGFRFVQDHGPHGLAEIRLPIGKRPTHLDRETWVIHHSRLDELRAWWRQTR